LLEVAAIEPARVNNTQPVRVDSEPQILDRYRSYLTDESGFGPGKADIVFLPNDEGQVADFLKEMNERGIPVTVSGGRTGIVGGAVPAGGALLSLDRMNRILGVKWDTRSQEWRMLVEPGMRLNDLEKLIATKNLGKNQDSNNPNWNDLNRFLNDPDQYFYPPDPTEESASIGGTVATDASGARTYFYGRTRQHIRALRIVLATGETLALRRGENTIDSSRIVALLHLDGTVTQVPIPNYERPDVKCATGYYSKKNMDLIDLFIGSEGTLGVITRIEVALKVKPQTSMFLAFFPSMHDATSFVLSQRHDRRNDERLSIHSMEYFDDNSLKLLRESKEIEEIRGGMKLRESGAAILSEFAYKDVDAIQPLIEALQGFHSSADDAIGGFDEQGKGRLRALRHALPEAINRAIARRKGEIPGLHKLGTDTAVPDDRLLDLMNDYRGRLSESGLEYYLFGHIAENHLHVNVLPKTLEELQEGERLVQQLAEDAVALGGVVSAEHGIGKLKQEFLKIMFDETKIQQMMATKKAFDPNWILSPGNIFKQP
jgi:D-lactate dehydrogenase (cytochrome)